MTNTDSIDNVEGAARKVALANLPKRILISILFTAVLLATLTAVAGDLRWREAWIFSGSYGSFLVFYVVWGTIRMPELLQERARPKKNMKRWDLVLMRGIYTPLMVSTFVLAGLDHRFGWSHVPIAVKVTAGVVVLGAMVWILRVLATNQYASGVVRIQNDRGQTVVSTGPYRVVRHPMYLGNVTISLGIPVALGSWPALLVGLLVAAVFVIRITFEDRTLHAELAGYPQYAQRVKSRLIPGIW